MEIKYYSEIGLISNTGYEIYRKKNFALAIQARINYSNINLQIGKTNGFATVLFLEINFIKPYEFDFHQLHKNTNFKQLLRTLLLIIIYQSH